jgi:hypothetical protein
MLIKNPDARQANTSSKGRVRQRAPALTPRSPGLVYEPQWDWTPLWKAPFYCVSHGYAPDETKWTDGFRADVESNISQLKEVAQLSISPINNKYRDLCKNFPTPTWSFERLEHGGASITAMKVSTIIRPSGGEITVWRDSPDVLDGWIITGWSKEILKDPGWDTVPAHERLSAQWHRYLLEHLFQTWDTHFYLDLATGRLHIMARKNSILAPFERITWDQWQFFKLNDEPPMPSARVWYDPRTPRSFPSAKTFNTATGPANEK